MEDMGDWQDKDDAELTGDDLADMMSAGTPIEVTGRPLPGNAVRVAAVATYGARTHVLERQHVNVSSALRVTRPLTA